ncbi:hypothetical protein C8K61_101130 [Pseudomonas sp. GV071]|nr:hypothetical protein C8K61_101130 [Pseudomonas sp. GV071]
MRGGRFLWALVPMFCQISNVEAEGQKKLQGKDTIYYSEVAPDFMPGGDRKVLVASTVPRPAGSFDLIAGKERKLCRELIDSFNESGSYSGEDRVYWGLENSALLSWNVLETRQDIPQSNSPSFNLGLEYMDVDVDGDGVVERVYRKGELLSSRTYQEISIFSLAQLPEEIDGDAVNKACKPDINSSLCREQVEKLRIFLNKDSGGRKGEWQSASDMSYVATSDGQSRKIIFPKSRNTPVRNVAANSGGVWDLYKLKSGVVVVSAPTAEFARPEYLVFSPRKNDPAILQCVISPIVWRR